MKLKIKTKLIAVMLLLITIPLVFLGSTTYIKAKKELKKQFEESMVQLNNQIKESIEEHFGNYKKITYILSTNNKVEQIINNPENEFYIKGLFKSYMESYNELSDIYMGTANGKMIIYPEADLGNFDLRTTSTYKKAVENQRVIFSDVFINEATKKLCMSVAAPVYENGDKNKLVGVIGVTIPLDELSKKISSIKVGQNGYPGILDSDGKIITHKDIKNIGKKVSVPEIVKAINSNSDGIVDYKWKEKDGSVLKKLGVYTKVPELEWTIMTTMYVDEVENGIKGILINIVLIGVIVLMVALGVGILFSNRIAKPIELIASNMNKVKEGDFTVKSNLKLNDEIGILSDGFNIMVENVKELLLDAKRVSEEVSNTATNLAATSQEASASSEEIAKTIEEIARGAQQQAQDAENGVRLGSNLDDKFNKLVNNTKTMSKNAKKAINVNIEGVNLVNELKEKTNLNNKSINKIGYAVKQLSEKSNHIEDILQTIRSIAEQTNLLALNASIEAARAGEAGRGFAVVAQEIRKLAEGSSAATDEIKEIVESIKYESENTVSIMDEVKNVSVDQTKSVWDVNNAFEEISKSIDGITNEIEQVNKFVNEIIKDKDLIVDSIQNISAVSEETAASSEEVTASAQQQAMAVEEVANSAQRLNELSLKLNERIDKFKV
ncbi:methyl-accepting chemotaxis protein [Tepidibacter formicigenes]|jgi:methyl-accepting chemotaxis protein|uniref:Methyl-accepting chemotaxis sensory transducer with Cache sensor n=1 Tax=Tepidibacter formicigenes DSM 15518 TaxID=1123349 RepID=A0A1M6NWI5_9FIRM|nr:methyl-accepting chemotaxis protein [Tepidibacter formicigenes]SHJ99984.1 methyl-accepting chemotaxis sensory transducer with Cache sensor [Tepidibacter formicigenes DSM 15518]